MAQTAKNKATTIIIQFIFMIFPIGDWRARLGGKTPRSCSPLVGRSNLSPPPPLVIYHLDDKPVNGKQSDCGTENN